MKPLYLAAASGIAGAALAGALLLAFPALLSGRDEDDAAGAKASAPVAQDGMVMLDRAGAARAGIRLVTLAPSRAPAIRRGFARALDISALAAIEAEIVSARAALAASQADYARQHALASDEQSASVHAVEIARAQALADQARLTAAIRRIELEYGPALARGSPQALDQTVRSLADGETSLIRVDFTDGTPPDGTVVQVGEGPGAAHVRLIGAAANADLHLQSAGALAIVRGPLARELGTGRVLPVSMAGSAGESGTLVPRDALLRYQGSLWVYRLEPGGGYRRVELTGARPQAGGWFAPSGVRPGDRVAIGGPAVLLFMERGGEPMREDD
ncbi:efflux RND transporter periplasmic adaptor subunit [Sphingobium chungbukense]|uniref:Uncharacterized protein n=1 Tax=Sphingobium chungbukense TaxID=56193 RepID=A0A0M3AWK3_9SPHN|nr:hypothetical protein [Sphingobium chungbukense]KKW93306.1 hypothetical protein YP76_00965 [Sphingobium chungbukense]